MGAKYDACRWLLFFACLLGRKAYPNDGAIEPALARQMIERGNLPCPLRAALEANCHSAQVFLAGAACLLAVSLPSLPGRTRLFYRSWGYGGLPPCSQPLAFFFPYPCSPFAWRSMFSTTTS